MLSAEAFRPFKDLLSRDGPACFNIGKACLDLLSRPFLISVFHSRLIRTVRRAQRELPGRSQCPLHGIADGKICQPQQLLWNLHGDGAVDASNLCGHDFLPFLYGNADSDPWTPVSLQRPNERNWWAFFPAPLLP